MSEPSSPPLNVLMLAPDPRVRGGVASFIAMLSAHTAGTRITLMPVGSLREAGEGVQRESLASVMKRIVLTPVRVLRRVRGERFDVVHVNPSLEEKSLLRDSLILLALRLGRARGVLIYFHGWRVPLQQQIGKTVLLKRVFVWLLGGAQAIAVLAPEFKEGLESMGVEGRRIIVTRTMFDGTALKNAMSTPLPRTVRRNILFLSRFSRKKGVYELLSAFASIARDHPGVDLVMAGDGEEMAGLTSLAKALGLGDRVKFPGYVTGEEKWRLLLGCTVFALPTYFAEGMPVAIIEAMAAGKPLLTTQAGGIRHIASDPENGVVLTEVSNASVARGLKRLLLSPNYCRDAGERNRTSAWAGYEAAKVGSEMEAVYREIAAAGREA